MENTESHRFMRFAMEEGRKAIPICGDNPPVGCVIVREGTVIARGHTNAPGEPHAEAMALSQIGKANKDEVMFVTLEPCSFDGRTPSCARAIVDSGIKSVYVGMLDPDARNNGKGIKMLENSGIDVHIGTLEVEIAEELEDYLGRAP